MTDPPYFAVSAAAVVRRHCRRPVVAPAPGWAWWSAEAAASRVVALSTAAVCRAVVSAVVASRAVAAAVVAQPAAAVAEVVAVVGADAVVDNAGAAVDASSSSGGCTRGGRHSTDPNSRRH